MQPTAVPLWTDRLVLEPLTVEHAQQMVPVLAGPALYLFTGGGPPTQPDLVARYERQLRGPDQAGEAWLNWIIRPRRGPGAVGFVQATVRQDAAEVSAEVAWVIGVAWQGNGYAVEAAAAMLEQLVQDGVRRFTAHIHPDNLASHSVARRLQLLPTDTFVAGERRWVRVISAEGHER
ncbi:MAG TPA: GNAT family N-acetyltransferase [Mycobacteriales bacterium]|nr:GNAT family N-acetyltransferase [Mycobacteriales bacterium]